MLTFYKIPAPLYPTRKKVFLYKEKNNIEYWTFSLFIIMIAVRDWSILGAFQEKFEVIKILFID